MRAAYALGEVVTAAALAVALISIPASPPGRRASVEVPGAILLGAGLLLALLVVSQAATWSQHTLRAAVLAAGPRWPSRRGPSASAGRPSPWWT